MKLMGKAHKFGDDINTDLIISGRYKFKTLNMVELAKHAMEDIDPTFARKVKPGDFVVAGKNFGMGSSREQAPLVIKWAGVSAVIAKSFARIFYRNAINCGLPALICDTDMIDQGDQLELDLTSGLIYDSTKKIDIRTEPLPGFMNEILADGGLGAYFKKHGGFKL